MANAAANATQNAQQAFGDFFKAFSDFRPQSFDMNNVLAEQRKNMNAMSEATRTLAEGVQAIVSRQAEILRQNVEQVMQASRDIWSTTSPETNATRQVDLAKSILQQNLDNVRELSEMASKSFVEATDTINRRFIEGIDSIGNTATQPKMRKAA